MSNELLLNGGSSGASGDLSLSLSGGAQPPLFLPQTEFDFSQAVATTTNIYNVKKVPNPWNPGEMVYMYSSAGTLYRQDKNPSEIYGQGSGSATHDYSAMIKAAVQLIDPSYTYTMKFFDVIYFKKSNGDVRLAALTHKYQSNNNDVYLAIVDTATNTLESCTVLSEQARGGCPTIFGRANGGTSIFVVGTNNLIEVDLETSTTIKTYNCSWNGNIVAQLGASHYLPVMLGPRIGIGYTRQTSTTNQTALMVIGSENTTNVAGVVYDCFTDSVISGSFNKVDSSAAGNDSDDFWQRWGLVSPDIGFITYHNRGTHTSEVHISQKFVDLAASYELHKAYMKGVHGVDVDQIP